MTAKPVKAQILEALEQGAATHREIAERLDLVPRSVSAYLCNMREFGLVKVKGLRKPKGFGRLINVWELA